MRTLPGIWIILLCYSLAGCSHQSTPIENLPLRSVGMQADTAIMLKNIPAKGYVLIFMAPECPICLGYIQTISALNDSFASDSICFMAVLSGKSITLQETERFYAERKLHVDYCIYDRNQALKKQLGATITPEVFVLDKQYQVLYSGKLDNWAEDLGVKRQTVTEFYLKDALNSLLKDEKPRLSHTQPVGCYIE